MLLPFPPHVFLRHIFGRNSWVDEIMIPCFKHRISHPIFDIGKTVSESKGRILSFAFCLLFYNPLFKLIVALNTSKNYYPPSWIGTPDSCPHFPILESQALISLGPWSETCSRLNSCQDASLEQTCCHNGCKLRPGVLEIRHHLTPWRSWTQVQLRGKPACSWWVTRTAPWRFGFGLASIYRCFFGLVSQGAKGAQGKAVHNWEC